MAATTITPQGFASTKETEPQPKQLCQLCEILHSHLFLFVDNNDVLIRKL